MTKNDWSRSPKEISYVVGLLHVLRGFGVVVESAGELASLLSELGDLRGFFCPSQSLPGRSPSSAASSRARVRGR